MTPISARRRSTHEAGFTLVELLVSTTIVLTIMGMTMTALSHTYRSTESASAVAGVNNNLRVAADQLVRDLLQVGQGMPTGRVVEVPNGGAALAIQRPRPQGSTCTAWPVGTTELAAVTPGPGCGPSINGVPTDMITVLQADSSLEQASLSAINLASRTVDFALPPAEGGVDISNGGADDVRRGDLIMLTKGAASTLLYVTGVNGGQRVTFATGDPMNLNQYDTSLTMTGTFNQLHATAPANAVGATGPRATRMRMVTYYVESTLTPGTPRLVRHLNWGDTIVPLNQRGRTVGFAVENLQFTYDLVDGTSATLTNVRMVAADLTNGGACSPAACSPNQIRKVNAMLTARARQPLTQTGRVTRNTLNTQVSLRSLALVDRYQ